MRVYVYGCGDPLHERVEVRHNIGENPEIPCPTCGAVAHRIPQQIRGFYQKPEETLIEWMDDNYRRKRTGIPLNSPDLVKRPFNPIPQTLFDHRKRVPDARKTTVIIK